MTGQRIAENLYAEATSTRKHPEAETSPTSRRLFWWLVLVIVNELREIGLCKLVSFVFIAAVTM